MSLRPLNVRLLFRRLRRGILFLLFLTVAVWGIITYQADHHTFAWDRTVHVAVVVLLDGGGRGDRDDAERFGRGFVSTAVPPGHNLRGVEAWINQEFARHSGRPAEAIRLSARDPLWVNTPPPEPPPEDASFLQRATLTRRFLNYFKGMARREDLYISAYDITLFVYFYDTYDRTREKRLRNRDSIASRRERLGVICAPLRRRDLGNTCAVLAHELCHALGASDKYGESGSVFPEGFAEPDKHPLYPQKKAEIMAMGRPVGPGREKSVEDLRDCVVGGATAREMGWLAGR